MALPTRQHSHARTNSRRSHWKARRLTLGSCPQCEATTMSHNACPKCGYYRGVKVDHTIKEKSEK